MLQKQNKNLKKGSLCKNGLQRVFLFFVFAFVSIATFASAQPVQAAAKQSTLSLTMETNKLTIALTPELNGKFGQSQNANISVTTDNFTGYRLTITSNGGTALVDGNGHSVESINTAISETTFRNNASYVNKWGYKPSQYVNGNNEVVTSNANYLPAPSTSGSLIDATSAANSTAKTYTLSIGAKIDFGTPPGTYTRNITVAAIANDIVYSITYNKNATGTVANMPVTNPQIVTIAGGTAAASSKTTLSSATPTRTGYDFMGWCSTTTTADAAGSQSCSGTTYAAGADYGIDQTADGTNITLYAIWQTHTYTVNLNGNGATTAGSSTTSVSYNATTLGSFTAPQRQYNVSGFTMGNNADGATVTFASTGNCTAANNCKSTYTFNGWYQESAAENKIAGTNGALESSTDYTNGSGKWVRSEEPTTLYAGWTSQSVTLPTINKSGYVCKWNTNSNGTGTSYNSGASITPAQATTLYGVCTAIDYTITINYGNGISSLAGAGWDDYGNSIKKIYHIGDTIDLTTITPTYNTGYNGAKYVKMDQNGTLSGSTYTVGAGDGAIKFSASGLDTPVCTMQGGYTKVYNYQDTIITATPNDSRYDSSVNITYSFGYSTGNSSNTLGNFDTATTDNTRTITKTDFLAARYYGVTVTVTDSSDSTITNTCTSGTGHQQGTSAAAARTLMALVNSRVDLNGNGGTLSGGTNPFYVQYGSSAKYTGRYNTTAVSALPTVTPPTGYDLAGWYTATTGGSKVLNANGSLTGSAVTNWSNANGQWVKTGSSNSENVAANQLYAHYTPKTYTITLNQNGATTNGSTSTTVSYDAYNLGSITLPQRQYTVSNFTTTNNNASGATVTFSDGTNCESASNCKSTYAFDGWYKEAAATNKIASEDTTPSLEANTDYTNADGQWNSTSNQTLYAGWTGESVTLPTITKTGYTCGWTTTSTGATTITYESGASIIPSSDYILYGVCTAKKYNINLEGNGATNNYTTSTKVTFNATALDAIATLPTKDSTTDTRTLTSFSTSGNNASGATVTYQSSGNCTAANNCKSTNTTTYTFKGWYKESAATTKVASNAAIPALQANVSGYTDSGAKWTKASTTTLYAGWTDNVGDYPTVTLPTITKTGYVCGWKDHNNNTYTSGETITPSDSLTMSGTCTIKSNLTLKVSFNSTYVTSVKVCTVAGDCSGDNLKGTVTTSGNTVGNLTYNTAYYLYPTYKTGAVLNSWAKDSGAVGSLSSTSAANPTYTIGDGTNAVTLNAKYDTYTITLNRNCSTTATGSTSTTVTYNATTLGAITVPTCANATGTRNINGFTLPSGNHADGATVTYPSTGCTSASNCKSTNTTTYTFKGWYKESAATNKIASTAATPALQPSTSYTNADSKWTSTSAQTLYAGWTASAGNYSSVTLPAIEKTGYTCGWTTTSTGATTITYASGSSLTPSSATTTLYGVCTADTYTITLNKNGATNSPTTSTTATYDSTTLGAIATLPTRVYTVSGFSLDSSATSATVTYQSSGNCTAANNCKSTYTFNGWYKESAATNKIASNAATPVLQANTTYTDADGKWTSTSDQTLYAGWTSQSVVLPSIAKTGHTCVWKDQNNNSYNSGDTITPSSNRTMTGYCTADTYTITLDGNGANNSYTTSTTVTYLDTALGALATRPTKANTTGTRNINGFTLPASNNADGATVTYPSTGCTSASNCKSTNTTTYAFNGWHETSGTGAKVASNAATPALQASVSGYTNSSSQWTKTSGTTLYAGWDATAGAYSSVTLPSISKTGYYCGWTTTATNATTITYTSGGSLTPSSATTTLYGVCTIKTDLSLQITFDSTYVNSVAVKTGSASGTTVGTVSTSGNSVTGLTYNTAYYLVPSYKTGAVLDSWSKDSGAVGTLSSTSAANPTYTIGDGTNAVTLNAKYATYNITLDRNCSTTAAGSTSTTVTYNATTLAAITVPTCSNGTATRTVSGWTTPAANNADGATVNGGTAPGTLNSTASITYTFNGWHDTSGTGTLVASKAATPALQASVSGYTDSGKHWTKTSGATLYAGWNSSTGNYSSITLPSITKTGYYCGWTTTATGATEIEYEPGSSFVPTANTTLYGVCTIKQDLTLKVSFNSTYVSSVKVCKTSGNCSGTNLVGTVSTSGESVGGLTFGDAYYLYPVFTTGSIFQSWAQDSGTVGTLSSTSASNPTYTIGDGLNATTITAKYNTYNITLDRNCSTTATGSTSTTVTYKATKLGAITVPTCSNATGTRTLSGFTLDSSATNATVTFPSSGNCTSASSCTSTNTTTYAFKGWYTTSGATTQVASTAATPALQASVTNYTNGSSQWTRTSATTLYAGWTATAGAYSSITLPNITKTGYRCYWTDGNTTYNPSSSIVPTDDLTISGYCEVKEDLTLKVSFNSTYVSSIAVKTGSASGTTIGTVSTSGNTVTVTYGVKYYLVPTYTTGSKLSSWAKDSGAVGTLSSTTAANPYYTIGDGVNAVTHNGARKTYTVTLNQCDATTEGSDSTTATYYSTSLAAITVPQRAYTVSFTNNAGATASSTDPLTSTYTFGGWVHTSCTGATVVANTAATPALQASVSGYTDSSKRWTKDGAATLYAKWTGQSVTLPSLTKTGNECVWSDGATTYTPGDAIVPASDLPLTAVCTPNVYTITLNKNGADNSPTSSTTVTYGATTLGALATRPSKNDVTGTRKVQGFTTPSGNHADGATVTFPSTGCTSASSCNSTNTTTYTFNGWHLSSGTGTKLASNAATPALIASVSGYTNGSKQWTRTSGATLYAGWDESVGAYSSITLPNITKTGYTCGWTTSSTGATTIAYEPGDAFTPASTPVTLYGVCVGNTYTATFYYQSDSTLRGETIATAEATCTVSNSAGNCSPTIPTEVTGSVGTYNNAYVGVASAANTMSSATSVTLTGDATFYAVYRSAVTLHKPGATTDAAATTVNLYRNQYFSSNSALATTVLSSSTTGKSNYTYTAAYTEDSGYALYGFATAIDSTTRPSTCAANGTTACSTITRLATSDISDAYAIEYKAFTATIYYNNNTTTNSCTTANVTTATKALNRYAYINASSQTAIKNTSIGVTSTSIPEAVRNSKGTCGESYLNVGTSTSNMTGNSLSSANGDQTYYTRYSASITNYYYNTSAYTSRTIYRNQRVNGTSASSMSTAVLATANTGTANYGTATGPGSSVWTGLSTSQPAASNSNAPTYTTVAGAATANTVYDKLYTTYTFNVTFAKGTNTSSIGSTSGSCRVSATGATSGGVNCNVEAPTISPKSGYTANGWSTTKDDTNAGTAAGSNISVNSNGVTYYGNSKANPYTITVTAGNGISALTASGWTGTGTATISKTFYTGDVVDLSTITPTRKTGYTGTAYEKTDTYGTLSGSNYTVGAGAGAITLSASALATPTCAISSSATTTVYNYQDTTITATDVSSNYDSGVTITYTFGYADTTSAALGNFEAGTNNTFTVAKDAYRGTRYYGTTISVTDGTLSKSCTSSTGTGTNGRKEVTYINSRIDFDANGGTLSGTSPLYVSYDLGGSFTRSSGSSAWSGGVTYDCNTVGSSTSCQYHYPGAYAYTTATDTTISELPSATSSQTGYQFDGWYTAATGGSRVTGQTTGSWYGSGQTTYASYTGQFIYAPNTGCSGSGCTSTVTGWKYGSTNVRNSSSYTQSRYWRKTGTNLNDNVAANKLYAHYVPKTYTVTLNSNNATNSPTTSATATYDSTTLSAIATLPTRSYTFDGFTLDSSASGATTTFASTGDCTSASSCTYNYTFNGWHINSGTGTKVASNASTPVLQASVSGYTNANGKWTRDNTATLYAGWTSASVTLPNLTKTGYTCEWRDQDNNTYTPGSAINQPTANRTLTGYCTGNTYTATFYYQSDPDLRDEAISTATAQCTVSNSAGNCTATIPSAVRSSVGTYNNAYAGVAATVNTMAAANSGTSVTLSGNANFYAIYRTNVTIHKPVSSTSTTNQALYRNSYFTSNSALTTKLSSSTTGTSHYSYTSSFTDDSGGYTFNRFSSDINSLSTISSTCGADGASSCNSIAGLATSNITEVYSVDKKTITATIYYNNNTTTNACTTAAVTSVASSANRYAYITAASVSSISDRNIAIPDEVKNSKGTCGQAYLNVGTATNNMTAVTPHTSRGNINYYTRYSSEITLYYYNSNAYTNRKLYRNQRVSGTSASSMSTAVLATANTGTSNNFTPPSGPGGAAFGMVRAGGAPCMTCEGTMSWSTAPTANEVYSTLYAGYSMDVVFAKGANTSSIGGNGGACMVTATGATTGSTSCTVTTPSISPKTGYTACGWSTTNGATSGTNANSSLTLSTSGQTYYGNSKDVTAPDYAPTFITGPFAIEINNNSYYAQFKTTVKANDSSGSNIRYTLYGTNAQSGANNTCANNTNCVISVVTSFSWQNAYSTKHTYQLTAYDAAGNSAISVEYLKPFAAGSYGGASIQMLYIYQLYGGIRANSSNYSWFNAVYSASSTEIDNKISQASSTRMATMIKDMFGSSEATTFFSGKSVDFKVDHLYHAILGRSVDSSGASTWKTMLNQGKSMRYVAAQMTKSSEAQQLFGKLGFITGDPQGDID